MSDRSPGSNIRPFKHSSDWQDPRFNKRYRFQPPGRGIKPKNLSFDIHSLQSLEIILCYYYSNTADNSATTLIIHYIQARVNPIEMTQL